MPNQHTNGPGPVAIRNKDVICERMATGIELDDVAEELGIKAPNISKYLADDPDYMAARESGMATRLRKAKDAIAEVAKCGVDEKTGKIIGLSKEQSNLVRAREAVFKSETFFAEREYQRWQTKSQVQVNVTVNLGDALQRAQERVANTANSPIDGDCERITDNSPTK